MKDSFPEQLTVIFLLASGNFPLGIIFASLQMADVLSTMSSETPYELLWKAGYSGGGKVHSDWYKVSGLFIWIIPLLNTINYLFHLIKK